MKAVILAVLFAGPIQASVFDPRPFADSGWVPAFASFISFAHSPQGAAILDPNSPWSSVPGDLMKDLDGLSSVSPIIYAMFGSERNGSNIGQAMLDVESLSYAERENLVKRLEKFREKAELSVLAETDEFEARLAQYEEAATRDGSLPDVARADLLLMVKAFSNPMGMLYGKAVHDKMTEMAERAALLFPKSFGSFSGDSRAEEPSAVIPAPPNRFIPGAALNQSPVNDIKSQLSALGIEARQIHIFDAGAGRQALFIEFSGLADGRAPMSGEIA
ncbi:MAG: hypothetical protein HY921_12545 [Elusimicrobia bacterium]|nr:hypothetical protein [Elusimicrobiota bacterium]